MADDDDDDDDDDVSLVLLNLRVVSDSPPLGKMIQFDKYFANALQTSNLDV